MLRTVGESGHTTGSTGTSLRVSLRVLLVEDSENDAILLLRKLRQGGYEPVHKRVDTPEELELALDGAQERGEPWELVISDYFMPRFRAPDALALLRRLGYDTPFIVVSGKVGEDLAVEVMQAGAQDYITKENMARLKVAVERGLREAEARRERERAEQALRQSESSLSAAQRIAHLGNWEYDIGRDEAYWSDELYRIFGFAPQGFVPTYKSFLNLIHPDDEKLLRGEVRAALYGRRGRIPSNIDYRIVRPNGEIRFVSTRYEVMRDASERPVRLIGTIHDVTERKQAEETLRESEERYRAVVEQAADGILLIDVDSKRILEANAVYQDLLGYAPEEILDLTLYDLVPYSRESMDCYVERVRIEKSYVSGERRHRRKDGSLVDVEVSANTISYSSKEALCVVVRDITERKRSAETLRETREAERQRMARDLHDGALQDLTYALAEAQILQVLSEDPKLDERLKQQLEALRRAAGGLRSAVYNLRLEDEQNRPFRTLLETLVEQNRNMVPDWNIHLEVADEVPQVSLKETGTELLRVVQEGLSNARRHSEARNVRVTVWVESNELVAEVSDDGRGFGPDSGSGIGLKSMKERTAALGGEVAVESEPGEGTRVRIRTPMPR